MDHLYNTTDIDYVNHSTTDNMDHLYNTTDMDYVNYTTTYRSHMNGTTTDILSVPVVCVVVKLFIVLSVIVDDVETSSVTVLGTVDTSLVCSKVEIPSIVVLLA
jgi:hypothetical protein